MSKGAQDWVARTDLLLQTLSEIIQRPRYGTRKMVDLSGYVAASSESLIVDIVGEGLMGNVFFWATSTGVVDNDYLKIIVDGETMILPTFLTLKDYNFTMGVPSYTWGSLYDGVNYKVAGGFTGVEYTWNTSYKLYYVETYGRNPLANIKFFYGLF